MDNNRSWEKKQDVEEILDIIDYSLYSSKEVNRNFFLWYITKKGKFKSKQDFVINEDIRSALDRMDTLVGTIKAFDNLDMNVDNKKKEHILNIVSMARDDMKNVCYRFEGFIRIFVGFMYGYYLKANIITAVDIINMEDDTPNVKGIPSYAITIAAILKSIDNNAYLDRQKFPKLDVFPPNSSTETPAVLTTNVTPTTKPLVIDLGDKQKSNTEEHAFINQYITIKGNTPMRPGKKDVKIDLYEAWKAHEDGMGYKELAIIYDVSDYTILTKIKEFAEANHLSIAHAKKPSTKGSGKKTSEPKERDEDELLFEKACMHNSQAVRTLKNNTIPQVVSVKDSETGFKNYPIKYSTGANKKLKLEVSDKLKNEISKKGPGFYKLNDNMFYFITSGDYLIFRNEPTPEMLEKYRSVKTFG